MKDRKEMNIRRLKAFELRAGGLTWREVGEQIGGVSQSRAAQLGAMGERLLNAIKAGKFADPKTDD